MQRKISIISGMSLLEIIVNSSQPTTIQITFPLAPNLKWLFT